MQESRTPLLELQMQRIQESVPIQTPYHPTVGKSPQNTNDKIFQVYREPIMCNDGTHIVSSIQEDREWQEHWKIIVNLPNREYDLQKNSTGKKFLDILASEVKNVVNRNSNFEKVR